MASGSKSTHLIKDSVLAALQTMNFDPTSATLRIILERPPAGIDFALQQGHGNAYQLDQKQRSTGDDLQFEFPVKVRPGKDQQPNFTGDFVQGPVGDRFVYINIGTYAGQANTQWSRRLKIPLAGISWDMLRAGKVIAARVPGTAKNGEPTCAYSWRKQMGPAWGWRVAGVSK